MDEEKQDEKHNKDIGVSKDWLLSVLEEGVEKPKSWTPKQVEELSATRPKSRIQGLLQEFYFELADIMKGVKMTVDGDIIQAPDEDYFSEWYPEHELEEYSQVYKLMQFFNRILQALHMKTVTGYDQEAFSKVLAKIAVRCLDENEYIEIVAKVINEQYPGLAMPYRSIPSAVEMNDYEKMEYEKTVSKLRESVESNIDQYADIVEQLEEAAQTDFEKLASVLNTIVIFGQANWELVLYSMMSPRSPRLIINSLDYRANLHTLLAGDISTAKSKILEIIKLISPKMLVVDETTKASLEGVAPLRRGDDIEEGILEVAARGNIIIEELTNQFAKMALWRRAMDCKYIQIFKQGTPKGINVNTTVLAACNPQADFFQEETYFRTQLGFKEGILSRFDVLIPLTATTTTNKMLVDKLNLFGEATQFIDLEGYRKQLQLIASGMDNLIRVVVSPEQLQTIRQVFKDKNEYDHRRRILKNRPLVLMRDLETLARLVNTIAAVNFSNRKVEEGTLFVTDEDVAKAIRLWENLLQLRIQLYGGQSRILKSVSDEIVIYIINAMKDRKNRGMDEEVPLLEVYQYIVEERRIVSRATFYREVEKARGSGRIVQMGKRNATVKVLVG